MTTAVPAHKVTTTTTSSVPAGSPAGTTPAVTVTTVEEAVVSDAKNDIAAALKWLVIGVALPNWAVVIVAIGGFLAGRLI